MSELILKSLPAIEAVPASQWNVLVGDDHPFLRHEFLHALEASGVVSPLTGWIPDHLTLWRDDVLVGGMPHYRKLHSYGEYVFDWAWADAWERAGGRYYPKGLTAIPFSPVPGPRLALAPDVDPLTARDMLAETWEDSTLSSWHLLFAEDAEVEAWLAARPDLLVRHGVQFQWNDRGYGDFEGFLSALTAKRRKTVRRERRRVAEQGVSLHRLVGEAIGGSDLE